MTGLRNPKIPIKMSKTFKGGRNDRGRSCFNRHYFGRYVSVYAPRPDDYCLSLAVCAVQRRLGGSLAAILDELLLLHRGAQRLCGSALGDWCIPYSIQTP